MSKDMAAEWGYVLMLFVAVFVLYTVHGDARTIVMIALLISLITVNAIRLIRAAMFKKAVKNGQTMRVTGTVTFKFGHKGRRLDTCAHAWARYSFNGKELIGAMICAADQRLQIDQSIDIIVPKSGIKVFAFSEKQVRAAVLTYAVYSVIAAAIAAVLLVCLVMMKR